MRDERYRRLPSVCLRAYPFVTLAVGKRTRNRMFNDTDFRKEKKEVGEVSERNVTGIQGKIGRNSGNGD